LLSYGAPAGTEETRAVKARCLPGDSMGAKVTVTGRPVVEPRNTMEHFNGVEAGGHYFFKACSMLVELMQDAIFFCVCSF
jgi:hypothetical protein